MSSESATHKRNLESSILFMQQEHAAILKGLHEEITRLQKRCTDLTFQLTMHGLSIDESEGSVDNQMQQVHQELETSRAKITSLEKQLSERDSRVERLETEARAQRKRWLDESRAQSQAMNSLRAELEAKANNIAYLTTELHRLKQRSRSQQEQQGTSGDDREGGGAGGARKHQPGYLHTASAEASGKTPLHPQHFMPAPPQREKTLGAGSARIRRSGGHSQPPSLGSSGPVMATGKGIHQGHPASADAHLVGRHQHKPTSRHTTSLSSAGGVGLASNNPSNPGVLRLSSGRSSGSESPDITPFLPAPPKEEEVVVQGKQAPVLPPIPAGGGSGSPGGSGLQHLTAQQQQQLYHQGAPQVLVHKVVSSTSQHRQMMKGTTGGVGPSASKTEAALVTLAVENAASGPDAASWALAQESRGGAEYN